MNRALILRPLINEKSMMLMKTDMYTFEVDKDASKDEIKSLVKNKFNVDILEVKTVNIKGKQKAQPGRSSRRGYYQTSGLRKAIVKVKPGQKISIFEVANPEEEVEVKTAEGETVAKTKEKKSLLSDTKVKIERADEGLKEKEKEKKGGKK